MGAARRGARGRPGPSAPWPRRATADRDGRRRPGGRPGAPAPAAGEPGGIAFVVAIKGLGRYPELREHPVASERFVIGTLASMCWAATVGVAANAVLVALG